MPSCATWISSSRRPTTGSWIWHEARRGRRGSTAGARTSLASASTAGRAHARRPLRSSGKARMARSARRRTRTSATRRTPLPERWSRSAWATATRSAIYLPMAIETVAAVMACAKIGAVCVPIFSGFGPDAVAARLADAGCRVLITANGSLRKGAPVPMKAMADRRSRWRPVVEHVLVWERLAAYSRLRPGRDHAWSEIVDRRRTCPRRDAARCRTPAVHRLHERHDRPAEGSGPRPRRVPREDRRGGRLPGRPASRRACCIGSTDLGWIMGPWEIVGALALGATVFCRGRADPPGARPPVGTGGGTGSRRSGSRRHSCAR